MARQRSIVLTKEEKKSALADRNAEIKAAKQEIKEIGTAIKDAERTLAQAAKATEADIKKLNKALTIAEKKVTALELEKENISSAPTASAAPVPAPASEATVVRRTRRTKAEMEAARAAGLA